VSEERLIRSTKEVLTKRKTSFNSLVGMGFKRQVEVFSDAIFVSSENSTGQELWFHSLFYSYCF